MAILTRTAYSYRRIRPIHIVAVFLLFIVISLVSTIYETHRTPSIYRYTDGRPARPWKDVPKIVSPEGAFVTAVVQKYAQKYGLPKSVQYYARRIRPVTGSQRESVTPVGGKFSGAFKTVRLDGDGLNLPSEKPMNLPVSSSPKPHEVDASSLLFGISSNYDRITHSNNSLIHDWSRWLTDGHGRSNGASLLLTLHQPSDTEVDYVAKKLTAVGIDAVVLPAGERLDSAGRYIDLIHRLVSRGVATAVGTPKKYLGLVDDDVFFPTVGQLLTRLARYNPEREYYIGLPSERSDWIVDTNAEVTYGGGAVFLTPPAASALAQLPCLPQGETSDARGHPAQWDGLLYDCVSSRTKLNLHVLPSFYSPEDDDVYGAQTVSYELGTCPLTLHHYSNRHRFEPGRAHVVASVCGEECFLQRWRFRDNWILVNGHSISQYPDGMDVVSLNNNAKLNTMGMYRVEKEVPVHERIVIDNGGRNVSGNARVVTWAGSKRVWPFLDASVTESGEVWQAYLRRRGASGLYTDGRAGEDKPDSDSIIVLIWEPQQP